MIFKIRKNNHYSGGFIHKLFHAFHDSNKASHYTTFDNSTLYVDDTVDKFDVNKLFGFSIGLHHYTSYRFGWNCIDNEIHIYAYSYVKGKRLIDEICVIDNNVEYKFIILIKNGRAVFTVISPELAIKQAIHPAPSSRMFGYSLWPYFGGNKVAPHDINIEFN